VQILPAEVSDRDSLAPPMAEGIGNARGRVHDLIEGERDFRKGEKRTYERKNKRAVFT